MKLALKLPLYWMFREIGHPVMLPFNYTFSITYRCNSRCKTCNIWRIQHRIKKSEELSLDEWKKIIKSLGDSPFWITISGGEPFLREDLVEIVDYIDKINKPRIINIPTNGTLPETIRNRVEEILNTISEKTNLIINFSLDGISKLHDYIRGYPGNYSLLKKSYMEIKQLKKDNPNLTIGIHTVISKWNVDHIKEIYQTVMQEFKPDQYITEIAEKRREMENLNQDITPPPEKYIEAINFLIGEIKHNLKSGKWKGIARITEAFRIQYYELVKKILTENKQVVKSYAGYASAHISPTGEVWECAVYATPMGNLRRYNYDFEKLWRSLRANKIREKIRKRHICPLASENYTNLLLSLSHFLKVIINLYLIL